MSQPDADRYHRLILPERRARERDIAWRCWRCYRYYRMDELKAHLRDAHGEPWPTSKHAFRPLAR